MKHKDWFKIKFYPHIGLPLKLNEKQKICSYIKDQDKIKSHSFLPFIHKTIVSRKLRKSYSNDGTLLNNGKRVIYEPKKRPIHYSSHLDANIFSYYGFILNKEYNKKLKINKLENVVTAYRQIPIIENGKIIRNKCNIDFANDVFNFIRNQNEDVVAITFDIKGFFDNLNHKILKDAWCKLFNWEYLKDDHYNVFRNITKFSYVEEEKLFDLFKDKIIIKTSNNEIKKISVDKLKYLYNKNAIAFCEKKQDIDLIRRKGLIKSNKYHNNKLKDFGICQGSPISSVLANIYLFDFDKCISDSINNEFELYRRYSDDMVIICPIDRKQFYIELVEKQIVELAKLEIQKTKTQIFHFKKQGQKKKCLQEFDGQINQNSHKRKFEYLGFCFDGETTLLKTSSLAKYYRKLKLNVRRCVYYSSIINNKSRGQIFKRRIYKKFSYIGSKRNLKYKRKFGTTNEWVKSKSYNWGNFITYSKLAINSMQNNKIKSQIKKHWKNINKELKKYA